MTSRATNKTKERRQKAKGKGGKQASFPSADGDDYDFDDDGIFTTQSGTATGSMPTGVTPGGANPLSPRGPRSVLPLTSVIVTCRPRFDFKTWIGFSSQGPAPPRLPANEG